MWFDKLTMSGVEMVFALRLSKSDYFRVRARDWLQHTEGKTMAYNEALAARIRRVLAHQKDVAEKRMFGGLTFMVDGVQKDDLMVRVSVEEYEKALSHPHYGERQDVLRRANARPMDFTGKPFPGFLYIGPSGYETDDDLQMWLDKAITYNASLPSKTASRQPRKQAR